jgi:hypothetical protein
MRYLIKLFVSRVSNGVGAVCIDTSNSTWNMNGPKGVLLLH